jgi:hypothetical protein
MQITVQKCSFDRAEVFLNVTFSHYKTVSYQQYPGESGSKCNGRKNYNPPSSLNLKNGLLVKLPVD